MRSLQTTALAALALLCAASPAIASPKVLQVDVKRHKRAASSNNLQRRQDPVEADLGNYLGAGFYALNISLGTPGQQVTVVLDTGSSDLWVPVTGSDLCTSNIAYCDVFGSFDPRQSSSYTDRDKEFIAAYGDGTQINGTYANDTVAFAGATVTGATFAAATTGVSNDTLTGIMGIGYSAGESFSASNENSTGVYPNIVQSLKDQGVIDVMAYSLWLNDLCKLFLTPSLPKAPRKLTLPRCQHR